MDRESFVVGLIEGEGGFAVDILNSSSHKMGKQVKVRFHFSNKNRKMVELVQDFLECGKIQKHNLSDLEQVEGEGKFYQLQVQSYKDIAHRILPLLDKSPLENEKRKKVSKVVEMMEKGEHLTSEGLAEIERIKKSL